MKSSVIREQGADMLVMGTHGRGFFGRLVIGSVTEGILRRISIPVVTVCRATKPLAFNRILFATDLSESLKRAFGFALELARTVRSDLLVVQALDRTALSYGGAEMVAYVNENILEEANAKFAELAAEAKRGKVRAETVLVEGVAEA